MASCRTARFLKRVLFWSEASCDGSALAFVVDLFARTLLPRRSAHHVIVLSKRRPLSVQT